MIKCNVTVCGTISREAAMRTNKEGKQILGFGVNVMIPGKSGDGKVFEVSVSKEAQPEEILNYPVGTHVQIVGTLLFHKKGESLYLNMTPIGINTFDAPDEDSIKGDMEFRGGLGKKIETKTDKKGNPYCIFSAYSSEKNGDNFDFTWIRFLYFGQAQQDWMQPKVNIQAKGELQMTVFNDRLDIACRVSELSKWEKQPYNSNR